MAVYRFDDDSEQTALMAASYHGDLDEVERLLGFPNDVDARDTNGMTALMFAALKGHAPVIERLLEEKSDPEIQSAERYTALMYAVRNRYEGAVRALLRAGVDPDVHEDNGCVDTPLTLAAERGLLPIVRLLVAAGADVALHGGYGCWTPECVARINGHHEVSEFLCYHQKRPGN